MALSERTEEDRIEILVDGQIQVRTATVIERDGVEISRTFHRHVVDPLDDVSSQSQRVKDIAAVVHTPNIKTSRQTFLAAQKDER